MTAPTIAEVEALRKRVEWQSCDPNLDRNSDAMIECNLIIALCNFLARRAQINASYAAISTGRP